MIKYIKYSFKHYKLLYLFSLIDVISFILVATPTLGQDEPFTISLIKHSYKQIINLDLFDVHPPLYYIILKLFLDITTFWTNSIIVKIIFGRILTLIFFIISFKFLLKILKLLHIKSHPIQQCFLLMSFPIILQYSLTIRMYQLATMLIIIEIYGIITFEYNKKSGLIIAIITTSLIIYINYFAAAFAGALMLTEIISYLFKHFYKKALFTFLACIIDIILYIPCIPFLYYQITYVSSHKYSNFVGVPKLGHNIYVQLLDSFSGHPSATVPSCNNLKSIIFDFILLLLELICLVYIFRLNNKFSEALKKISISFILGFMPSIILSYVKHPMIMARYGYPLFFIIFFLIISFILYNKKFQSTHHYLIIMFYTFLLISSIHVLNTYISETKEAYNDIHTVKIFTKSKSKNIHLNGFKAIDCSTYLNPNSKKRIKSNKLPTRSILASNNSTLLKRIFNNITIK